MISFSLFSEKANLKHHPVQDESRKIKNIFTGADVEIHANNGEYYALDFARLMPPSTPNSSNRFEIHFFLFFHVS